MEEGEEEGLLCRLLLERSGGGPFLPPSLPLGAIKGAKKRFKPSFPPQRHPTEKGGGEGGKA